MPLPEPPQASTAQTHLTAPAHPAVALIMKNMMDDPGGRVLAKHIDDLIFLTERMINFQKLCQVNKTELFMEQAKQAEENLNARIAAMMAEVKEITNVKP
jgi:hypothetical protein